MLQIGILKESKINDSRVAFTPKQCKAIEATYPIKFYVQKSDHRCIPDKDYLKNGIDVVDSLENCQILMGIKEVHPETILPKKTYIIFSHTKKLQSYNRNMFQTFIEKKATLIDYECLEYVDGTRILGFGFFAGIVGAHNGLMAYGIRTNTFNLNRVYKQREYKYLISNYFGLKIPPIKIVVTGSGRVSKGIIEIMNLLDIKEIDEHDFIKHNFTYPVFLHLKGDSLYKRISDHEYDRIDFHSNPEKYYCTFSSYLPFCDILLNGVYWNEKIPQLFSIEQLKAHNCLTTIADITDDFQGSVPCNLGEGTIENPVYGYDLIKGLKSEPYLPNTIDIMAVGNLPNELPKDSSFYFGEQLFKNIIPILQNEDSPIIKKATILKNGVITPHFAYMKDYASL